VLLGPVDPDEEAGLFGAGQVLEPGGWPAGNNGSSDEFDPGSVEGEQFEDEETFIPAAIGLAGEGLDLAVDAFQNTA
jgi:hypothetical protein